MNDFEGLLTSDFGFKPSKSVPMSASSSSSSSTNRTNFDLGSRSARASGDDGDSIFSDQRSQGFGGPARHGAVKSAGTAFDFDSVFDKPLNSEPVFDRDPVYDDDIFNGVPGIRSSSSASKVKYDNVFATVSSSSPPKGGGGGGTTGSSSAFDDLLGGFGKAEPPRRKSAGAKRPESMPDFGDLLPGFGDASPPTERSASEANWPPEASVNVTKTTSKVMEDPFVVTGQSSDPLEEISKLSNSGSMKSNSVSNGRVFDDMDPFDVLVRSASSFTSERENRGKETSMLRADSRTGGTKSFPAKEMNEKPSVRSPDSQTHKKVPSDNDWDSHQTLFDMPTAPTTFPKSTEQPMSPPSYASASFKDSNTQVDGSPSSEENLDTSEEIWLTVSEIPLFTQPTSAPPPSRPPPPRPVSKAGISSSASTNAKRTNNEFSSFPNSSQSFQVPNSVPVTVRSSVVSPLDQLDDFARGGSQDNAAEHLNGLSGEELEMNSVAAATMKEAMDRAEAKFRQAKEVREREITKARSKEGQQERDEKSMQDERAREKQERLERQRLQREKEEEEMEQRRLEKERERAREIEREREEKEREQRRLDRERERARQAVERATREARERAAVEARQRADRAKAEKAAVDKVTAEARERAERAAVQRAQAGARERAAAEAKERAEKAAAEARERANAEAKEREARERAAAARAEAESRARAVERAAVERAAAEARERAAAEARERAAAAARANQQKNENDLDSFFNVRNRPNSAPRPRSNSSDPFFDPPFQSRKEPEVARTSGGNPPNIKKASSSTNIVDDLTSIFNAAPSSGVLQEVDGESEERRRARLERHQRTQERALKALEEKNQRDLHNQREQAERHRIAETLDVEIKRWAAGKEGNLRALLSTLQYVLWPECGWQPVSLTDMITAASVKKVYRKATLCIHPDKVQQKGANLQQKYIAEKVFDLLKEAWNKLNSEELF